MNSRVTVNRPLVVAKVNRVTVVSSMLLGWALLGSSLPVARAASAPGAPLFRAEKRITKPPNVPPDPPEVLIGERLFLETRFAQFFAVRCGGDVNTNLPAGDPALETTALLEQSLPGRFRGMTMNCRACHLVGEHRREGGGHRSYADYATRSPLPVRVDGRTVTVRNAQALVNATMARDVPTVLHHDGEFATTEDLVLGTFRGRNFGWLPTEHEEASRHLVKVIRDDDGRGALAREFGGAYRRIFAATNSDVPEPFRLSEEYQLDVAVATDAQVLDLVARLVRAYLDSLFFGRNELDENDASPYDVFLELNGLPRKPDLGQSNRYYSRHLRTLLDGPEWTFFVDEHDGWFRYLKQRFRFGPEELAGMRIFFNTPTDIEFQRNKSGGIGNCIACHPAPSFTDAGFHNTGAAQDEYDALHGPGAFGRLEIPDLAARQRDPDRWLPACPKRPQGRGPFLSVPVKDQPDRTDLGLWNVFANPDLPAPQDALRTLLDPDAKPRDDARLLPLTVARFKTPTLRGLGMSDPYLHTGRAKTLEDVIRFYVRLSQQARAGEVRNAAPELRGMRLTEADVAPLAAFLRALNEDYE